MSIDTTADILAVRDFIERAEELEQELCERFGIEPGELADKLEGLNLDHDPALDDTRKLVEEAEELREVLDELKGAGGDERWRGDWYPGILIRDSYFETAMDDLVDDIGDIPKNLPPYLRVVVDYDALQMDYASIDIRGVTYWYR